MNQQLPKFCRSELGLLGALILGGLTTTLPAQVTNDFSDGEGVTSPNQYEGIAGDGWDGAWSYQFGVNSGFSGFWGVEPHVINTNPLRVGTNAAGGNYFNFGIANSESQIRRKYFSTGALNTGLAHVLEFDLRMDSFTGVAFSSSSDGISICTRRTTGTDVGGNATFWIRAQAATDGGAPFAQAGRWNFYNGGLLSSSDASGTFSNSAAVPFVIGRAYHFKIALDPTTKTYVGSVSDGTNSYTTPTPLRYKSYSDNNFANISNSTILAFVPRTSSRVAVPPGPTETNLISVDDIKIYADVNAIAPLITPVSPLPAAIFHPSASNLTFTAVTLGPDNVLPGSNMVLTLNGANVSAGLAISGTDGDANRTAVYGGLVPNTIYAGTFAVKDQNGRGATNSFFFDTFLESTVTIIEAENYNFETGTNSCPSAVRTNFNSNGYIQNPLPSGFDTVNAAYTNEVPGYVDRAGVFGVDYNSSSGIISQYRICDTLDTRGKPSLEVYRPANILYGLEDYTLEHLNAGDWANYTHVFPNTNYYVYVRAGARNKAYHYQLARVTSDRTQPNQTTVLLGTFTVPQASARESLRYQPLADAFGNPVLLRLNGEETLRLTALDAGNDDTYVNFLLFSPQPGTAAPPFVQQYYPTINESNIPPQTAISVTLANGSAPVSVGTIVLNVNGANVTSLATIAATAGGATVNYLPPVFFARPSLNTVQIIYGSGSGSLQTNQWSFHVGAYLPGLPIKVRFQQPASTNYPGYLPDSSLSFANRGNGYSYGWDRDFSEDTRQSFPTSTNGNNSVPPDARFGNFTHLNKASPPRIFEITIPNGNYGVYAVSGDPTAIDSIFAITVEGVLVVNGAPPGGGANWVDGTNTVTITDGRLTLTSAGGSNNKINFIDIWPLDYSAPDFTLRNPAFGGSSFSFNISTIRRALHVIEYKSQLTDPGWTTLTNIVGTGGSVTVTDNTGSQRFYRMRIP